MLFASFLHVTLVRDPGSSPGCGAPSPGVSIEVRFCPRNVDLHDSWPGQCPRDIISLFFVQALFPGTHAFAFDRGVHFPALIRLAFFSIFAGFFVPGNAL